jgi:hypothetical protein
MKAIILKVNKVNLFVSSVLFVFWCHSPNFLDTPHMYVCAGTNNEQNVPVTDLKALSGVEV